jgi:hypothetical protein
MIIVNRKPLNLDSPESKTEKWVYGLLKDISDWKRPLVIKDPKPVNPETLRKKLPKYFDAYVEYFNEITKMKEKWYLCERSDFNKGNVERFPKRKIKVQMSVEYDPKRYQEEIFFFTQIMKKLPHGLQVENKEREAYLKNAKRASESKAVNMIYNELSESDLKLVAYSRGMNVENISLDEIKNGLFEAVQSKGDYDKFLEETKDTEYVKLKALVNQATEKGIIQFVDSQYKVIYAQDQTLIKALNPINYQTNKVEQLVQHLQSKEDVKTSFLAAVSNVPVMEDIHSLAGDWKSLRNPMVLKKWGKDNLGLSFKQTDTLVDVQTAIEEEIKARQVTA